MDPASKRAFVALEGGGAKGVVHVGALASIRRHGYQIKGVAGTSAGSIVAALTAAGYTPDEIIDPRSDRTILSELDKVHTALDLLSPRGWSRLSFLRGLATWWKKWLLIGVLALLVIAPVCAQFLFGGYWGFVAAPFIYGALIWSVRVVLNGLTDLARLRSALGILLARRVFPNETFQGEPAPELVQFRHFGPGTDFPTLKIVATNQSKGQLQLFSPELTPNTPVADAVAASGSIPVVFRPWRINRGLPEDRKDYFFDGGLLSNLQTWVFDDECALDRDAWCISVEIDDGLREDDASGGGLFANAKRLVRTTIFGAQKLAKPRTSKSITVRLKTEIGILDMDMTSEEVRNARADAKISADAKLIFVDRLAKAPENIIKIAEERFREFGLSRFADAKFRATLTPVPKDVYRTIQSCEKAEIALMLCHHAGFEDSPDEFLNVPLARSFIGAAIRRTPDEGTYFDLLDPGNEEFRFEAHEDRWTRKFREPKLRWAVVIPISGMEPEADEPSYFVITLDCDAKAPAAPKKSAGSQGDTDWEPFKKALSWIEYDIRDNVSYAFEPE